MLCDEITTDLPLNVSILFTPKFHCELAGEGIEYAWGAAKRMYRRQPIKTKRSIVNFENLVTNCLNYVSVNMVRRFSGKARSYMLAYSHKLYENEDRDKDLLVKLEWNFEQNEKIQKMYRSHRDVSITDGKYIEKVLKESSCIKNENEYEMNESL